jgi:peroxiredoxin (alkyl hydroperoxide reductase subunit C)
MSKRTLGFTAVLFVIAAAFLLLVPKLTSAQVLGSCGTDSENAPAAVEKSETLKSQSVPLPGQHALNFELPAVVGDDIKKVKLSDFNGKWRVVCFYPADFTFV